MSSKRFEEELSKRIKMKRLFLGYNQTLIANRLNITQQAYSQIEKHPGSVALTKLLSIAEFLQISMHELFCTQHNGIAKHDIHIQTNGNNNQPLPHNCQSCISDLNDEITSMINALRQANQ